MYIDSSVRKDLKLAQKRFEEAKDAFDELRETLEVLADDKLLAGIKASESDYKAGRFRSLKNLKA